MKIHVGQREDLGIYLNAQPVQSQAKEIPLPAVHTAHAHHLAVLQHGAYDDPASPPEFRKAKMCLPTSSRLMLSFAMALRAVPLWVLELPNQLDAGQVAHLQDVLPVQNFGKIHFGVATSEIWSTVIFAATRLAKD